MCSARRFLIGLFSLLLVNSSSLAHAVVRVIKYCADNSFAEDDFKKSRATQDIVSLSKLSIPNLEAFFNIQGRTGV